MLGAAIEFIAPAFVDAKEGCVDFQGAAAGMISAFDFEGVAVVDASRDIKDHGVVEEVGAGEAEAVVAVGLGEVGFLVSFMFVIMFHIAIRIVYRTYNLFYHRKGD
mgnify:CR=1 FL=1